MNIEIDMPTTIEFLQDVKQLTFNVIRFVENEKSDVIISLNDVNDKL